MYGHRLLRELFGLLFLFCGLLMLLSLWSYDISDPTFNHAVSIKASSIHNAAGLFGAYLAGFLVDLFGIASFLWVFFFLAVGAGLVSRWLVLKWYRWIGYLLLYLCVLVFSSAVDVSIHGIHGGGLVGQWLCALSYLFFSPFGSTLLWVFAFLIAMELSFSISWLTLAGRLFSWIVSHIPSFGETFDLPGEHFGEKVKNFSLPSFSMKKVMEKLKSRKEEHPRPMLDILSQKHGSEETSPRDTDLTLVLSEDSSEGLSLNQNKAAPESGESPSSDTREKETSLKEMLSRVGEPETAQTPSPSSEHSVSGEKKEEEFILELEDVVAQDDSEEPRIPGYPVQGESSSQQVPVLPWDETHGQQDEETPAARAAISASSGMEVDDFPAMFTASSSEQKYSGEDTQVCGEGGEAPLPCPAASTEASGPIQSALPLSESSDSENTVVSSQKAENSGTPYPYARVIQPAPGSTQPPSSPSAVSGGLSSSLGTFHVKASGMTVGERVAQEIQRNAPDIQAPSQPSSPPYPYARVIRPAPGSEENSLPSASGVSVPGVPSATTGHHDMQQDAEYASVAAAVSQAMEEQNEQVEPAVPVLPVLPEKRILPLPPLDLLDPLPEAALQERPDSMMLARQGEAVITCLKNFNVHATLAKITPGPVITMFEVRPAPGVKATRITNLADDLAMSLKATAVRMQAPVPGTDTVGVEVPNQKRSTVYFREIVENEAFRHAESLLTVALGKDTGGRPFSADLARMPHLLVAGATGQGKSVCLNAILLSLLYRARPEEVQLILVDPKRGEFSMYADLPHLVHPVVTDMDLTKNALLWAIDEMNRRLSLFSKVQVRNITGYNERQARLREAVEAGGPVPVDTETGEPEDLSNMPFLVIVVDELADLMMLKRKEVEGSIVRLAQLARAAGIHLIIATQRPSVDVVTGLIKANFPCRIAFKVTSSQDSRTILDGMGAEKLLGMGDMLFKSNTGAVKRIHGAFVSDSEVSALVGYWKKLQKPNYKVDFSEFGNDEADEGAEDFGQTSSRSNDIVDDPVYSEAIQFVLENGKVSISLLQRRFRIGFNRAARFVEQMERDGILSQADGSKPRSVVRR